MRISVVARVIGLLAACAFIAPAVGCSSDGCPKNWSPCANKAKNDPCAQTCNGPLAYRCLPEPAPDGPLVCIKGAPCDPADHCAPSASCRSTTCDFSKLFSGPGVYTCTDELCCKTTVASGSRCAASEAETDPASWTGTCDDAGTCVPPDGN